MRRPVRGLASFGASRSFSHREDTKSATIRLIGSTSASTHSTTVQYIIIFVNLLLAAEQLASADAVADVAAAIDTAGATKPPSSTFRVILYINDGTYEGKRAYTNG